MSKSIFDSMKIVAHNIGNVRYPGFSQFQSQNCLQNSSHIWSFPKSDRFLHNAKSLNSIMYNLPAVKMTRSTSFGIGKRNVFQTSSSYHSPSPDRYNIKTEIDLNLIHHKGPVIHSKLTDNTLEKNKLNPGPGSYSVKQLHTDIPIKIKSRIGYFYDDDLKKAKYSVSMQRYHPNTILQENRRYRNITFGFGGRTPNENVFVKKNPGPGTYNVPSCFDRGYRRKLVLN